jgi:probable F420-dependent oxidoreductase
MIVKLAAERTWGAHTYFVPVEHTVRARQIMGPDAFLTVEQAVVLDHDPDRAREVATAHVAGYLAMAPHHEANVRRLGFADQDIIGGPSRRLVDAIVAHGDTETIRRRVSQHLQAGASHVCLQALTAAPTELPRQQWRELAPVLVPHRTAATARTEQPDHRPPTTANPPTRTRRNAATPLASPR